MGAQNVECVNGLFYAVVMESRGVYMSARHSDREAVRCGSAPKSLPRRVASGGDNEANRAKRTALNKDLDILAQIYDTHSKQVYAELETGVARTKWLLGAMSIVSVLLAIAGIVLIGKAVARPLADITRVTAEVAAGAVGVVIPNVERQDEVGALARSIMIFQHAMERNTELNRTVAQDAGSGCPQPAHRERGGESFRVSVEQALGAVPSTGARWMTQISGAGSGAWIAPQGPPPDQWLASNADSMWRGRLLGATRIASKRILQLMSSGWLASHASAAAIMRRC